MDNEKSNNAICIIPARGGSKRILNKNIKDFAGKPIIAYSIEAALESDLFSKVIVSTDSQEIADISLKYGAEIPGLRSAENADDHATLTDVLIELENEWSSYKYILFLLPTAPLISAERILEAMNLIQKEKVDTIIPVVPYSFPIQRAFQLKDSELQLNQPEYEFTRSQDLEQMYHDSGSFYLIDSKAFQKQRKLYGEKAKALILDETEVQDIDTPTDWKLAELKYKMLHEK